MSTPYKAERTLIGVAIEGTQKTEVVPERAPGFTTGNQTPPGLEIDWLEERPAGANRELHDQDEGQRSFEGGDWTLNPYDGWPLAYLFGAEETNGTGPTTHEITAKQDGPPVTATAEWTYIGATGQDDLVQPYLGVFPTDGEITQDNEGIMEVSISHEALGISSPAPRTTYTDVRPLPDRDPWKFSDVSSDLTLFGQTFARINDFSFEVSNQSEPNWYAESSEAPEPYEATYGMLEYTLDATITIIDSSMFTELASPSTGGFSGSIEFTKQHNTDETLTIDVTGCRMESAPHDIPESGPVEVDVSIIPSSATVTVVDNNSGGTGYLTAGSTA
jgi:hypothetical protein